MVSDFAFVFSHLFPCCVVYFTFCYVFDLLTWFGSAVGILVYISGLYCRVFAVASLICCCICDSLVFLSSFFCSCILGFTVWFCCCFLLRQIFCFDFAFAFRMCFWLCCSYFFLICCCVFSFAVVFMMYCSVFQQAVVVFWNSYCL